MADGSNLVTIRDIDVPFFRMVAILIKWSIAAIPAIIIAAILYALLFALIGGIVGSVVGIINSLLQALGVPIPAFSLTLSCASQDRATKSASQSRSGRATFRAL